MEEYLWAAADESSKLKHGMCARRQDDRKQESVRLYLLVSLGFCF